MASFVIAVDGPVASGKGTLAKRLAEHLGFAYLDTGSLYRAVGRKCLRNGDDPRDVDVAVAAAQTLAEEDLCDPHLREEASGEAASIVAAIPGVRKALLEYQRNYAACPPDGLGGAVLDGRDIGTVVCPGADVKLYVTASAAVRAHRRYLELVEKGVAADESAVLGDLVKRDERDQTRASAPLKPADDAVELDSDNMGREDAFRAALAIIQQKRK